LWLVGFFDGFAIGWLGLAGWATPGLVDLAGWLASWLIVWPVGYFYGFAIGWLG
jgi:hypothetical protein